jgi:serine/threonine protein kinase
MNRCLYCFGDLHGIAVFCQHCGESQEPAFDQLLNQTIANRYRIHRRLSQGEYSTLFAATDLRKDEAVVIKVSNPAKLVQQHLSRSIDSEQSRRYWLGMIERMRVETEALMKIRHPNIVRFYGTGMINDNIRYTVMEYLRGTSLREEITRKSRMPLRDVMEVVFDLSSVLRVAHARKIVHRDLNPGNIFLYPANNLNSSQFPVKLTGFGIAKFSPLPSEPRSAQHSFVTGTMADDPPERSENHCLDHRSDIYSLGAVIYEMLTGEPPFKVSMREGSAFTNPLAEPIPPSHLNPDVPPHIDQAILRALAKNPNDRQQSTDELKDQLQTQTEPIFFPLCVDPKSVDIPGNETRKGFRKSALYRGRYRMRTIVTAIAVASIAIISGRILLDDRLLNFFSQPDQKTVISTALPSPSPSSTVMPIELMVRPGTINETDSSKTKTQPSATPKTTEARIINETDSSKTKTQPSATPKTTEARIAKPGVQPDTLQSRRNETRRGAIQPEKDDKESQSMRPRMLQWSGTISRERVVKIDMPGVPGKIEISQAPGFSIEIIEPPTAANNWRHVTLRILGQGDVSFRLRWWPISRSTARG